MLVMFRPGYRPGNTSSAWRPLFTGCLDAAGNHLAINRTDEPGQCAGNTPLEAAPVNAFSCSRRIPDCRFGMRVVLAYIGT